MVVLRIFTADILLSSNKGTISFPVPYNDKAMLLIWRGILLSSNEIYLSLHRLKEIYESVQHHPHHNLHNRQPMHEPN